MENECEWRSGKGKAMTTDLVVKCIFSVALGDNEIFETNVCGLGIIPYNSML